ncbi:GIY-YIG nuclease family protein [Polaribacter haliotis]|uniref:GIY-YIG nuclease family protein n=1 Tax=Polaribacter haliotis TaxID=1888915 RepID=A0A7L8AFE7_9FLAO|nr:GIY-YIG nuclease family protein [Polaribacter haliotis]QOD60687.1 GIY-YIG nuclease family protein [Polaribacter haliotis]
MKNSKKGFVYTVVDKKTDKVVYVGITKDTLKSRKNDHIKKSRREKKYPFQNAIATLGVDAFKWEANTTLLNNDELAEKEKELISQYILKGNKLYNIDSGGGIQKTIYKYKIDDGSLLKTFDSLEEASKTVNSTKQSISKACLSSTYKHRGYLWSYKFKVPFIQGKDLRKKRVEKLSLHSGEIIETYNSVADASKKTGINKTSIAKVCRGERVSAGGYKWTFCLKDKGYGI